MSDCDRQVSVYIALCIGLLQAAATPDNKRLQTELTQTHKELEATQKVSWGNNKRERAEHTKNYM